MKSLYCLLLIALGFSFNTGMAAQVEDWKAYAELASSQYNAQLLARSDYLDWDAIIKEVEKEVETIRMEVTY